MNPILQETLIILFWSFISSAAAGALGSVILGWPFSATYMLAALTVGPTLAILRGRNREKDRLEIGERAGVELVAIILLLAIGWAAAQFGL